MILVFILAFFTVLSFTMLFMAVWRAFCLGKKLDNAISKVWSILPAVLKKWTVRYLNIELLNSEPRSFFFWVALASISICTYLLTSLWLVLIFYTLFLLLIVNKRRALIARNNRIIVRQLPDFCDLISMMIASGIPLISALERVSKSCNNMLLASEVTKMLSRLRRGTSFSQSMNELSKEYDAKQLKEWCSMVTKGYQQGASLTKSLRFFANQLRQELLNAAEKRAQEAPVKLLFPLVTCFFPVNFLVILGPVIVQMNQGGFG